MDSVLILVPKTIKAKHPSLASMKFIALCKQSNINFEIHTSNKIANTPPDTIFLSTLFTYNSKKYRNVINFYQQLYPTATWRIGGIFASLMPQYFITNFGIQPFIGLSNELDAYVPDFLELEKHEIVTD